MPRDMNGFTSSKLKNKHFKKHVGGVGGGTNWQADMPNDYSTADVYENAGISFMSEDGDSIEIYYPPDMVMRWNRSSNLFGSAKLIGGKWCLVTFHLRAPEPFLEALSKARPDILPRVIKFEYGGTLHAESSQESAEMNIDS